MKKVIFCLLLIITISAWAQTKVIKTCNSIVNFDGESKYFNMMVFIDEDDKLSGNVEVSDGGVINYERVEKTTYLVREGLSASILESDQFDDDINDGERFIVHALAMESMMSSGIELKNVRSLTIYKFIEEGVNIGMTAFAEASDQKGDMMGSFMGGFFVSPCK